MSEAHWLCPTGAEMRALERDAIERLGVPARTLMESAGRAVAEAIAQLYPHALRPLVACGGGNNGGDGFVVARELARRAGVAPLVLELARPDAQSPEAKANRELCAGAGVELRRVESAADVTAALAGADLVVDAVFGTGLSRPIEGRAAELLRALDASGLACVAIDLPSGLSSDTGAPLGFALRADAIVALGLPKLGVALLPTAAPILVADIGLPPESQARTPIRAHALTRAGARALLPARPLDAHKGTFGHVQLVAGAPGKTGAALLCAHGALRAGAGLVTLATPRALLPIYASALPELMCLVLDDLRSGRIAAAHVDPLLRALETRDALVVGPGLGEDPGTIAGVRALLARAALPTVVDADALNAYAGAPEGLAAAAPRVLTPHPGEASRLLGCAAAEIQADRPAAARALAARSGAIVILKGARSLIARPDGELCVNPTGGPGLAAGGSGDVLAGLVGALLAQGRDAWDAARLGAYLHGLAGDLGPAAGGLASELAARIPVARAQLLAPEQPAQTGALRCYGFGALTPAG